MRFLAATLLALCSLSASAEDTVILINQSEVTGRIVSDDGSQIVVDIADPAGRLTINYEDIATINGLSAERLRSYRRESDLAETAFGTRGIASPRGIRKETRGITSYIERVTMEPMTGSDLAALASALAKFRLAPAGWNASIGIPSWIAARRSASWDADEATLRLIVPGLNEASGTEPFWIAAGRKAESYPIAREVGRGALHHMMGLGDRRAVLRGWDDRSLAFAATETGLAAAIALDAILEPAGLTSNQGDSALALIAISGAGRESASAPEFLRAWRDFSETEGARFFRAARLAGGWRLALRVLEDIPVSTEQILHPERYFADRDFPTAVSLPSPAIPDGAGSLGFVRSGSLGEWFTYRSLLNAGGEGRGLDEVTARRAAAGWDGDAWVVLAPPAGEPALIWFTVWDTPQDAQEFAEAAADAALLRSERGKKQAEGGRIRLDTSHGYGLIETRAREVVVVEAVASPDVAGAFAEAAWRDAVRAEERGMATVSCSLEALAAAGGKDALAEGWPNEQPKADPISGTVETDPATKARVFAAAGAFQVAIPDGWEHKAEPTALTLTTKSPEGTATVTFTFHRLPVSAHPALVFARAWNLSCPKADGTMLPWAARTADGRGWFQFAPRNSEKRVHLAWAVSGNRLIRMEAVAPLSGPSEDARRQLQEALASVRFLR
ncbi:MAG: hypothetical protein HYY18_05285 [Planctomycetes bacterium]|nr:hypothetical protein [Planctomycetota bacterium]